MTEVGNMIVGARMLALAGLRVDGEHHKQWYLEMVLKELGVDLSAIPFDYEKGVSP
jgi:hypothetical protein